MTGSIVALAGFLFAMAAGAMPRWRRVPSGAARGVAWFAISTAASGMLLLPAAVRAGQAWFVIVELATAVWLILLGLFASHWRRIDLELRNRRSLTTVLTVLEICWLASALLLLEQTGQGGRTWLVGGALAAAALMAWLRPVPLSGPSLLAGGLVLVLALSVLAARTLRPEAYRPLELQTHFEPVLFGTLLLLAMAREAIGIGARRLAFGTRSGTRTAAWTHAALRLVLLGVLWGAAGVTPSGVSDAAIRPGLLTTLDVFTGLGPASAISSVAIATLLLLAIASWAWALVDSMREVVARDARPVQAGCIVLVLGAAIAAADQFAALRPVWAEAVDLFFGVTAGWALARRGMPSTIAWLTAVVVTGLASPWLPEVLPTIAVAFAAGFLVRTMNPGRPAES